ncbi:MAG: cobalamin B12-binding domain-containing protein [Elusimicrobia bacterium]|nr:cobalamin B12-binding domain-containing protein [Elusimicrobiota bacterium]
MKYTTAGGPTSKKIQSCDVLFINPPWVAKTQANIRTGMEHAMPPLSLLSLASYMEEHGYKVQVLDVHVERLLIPEIQEAVRRANPKWVGLTVLTATSVSAHKIARLVKEACPASRVVFGGIHAEAVPEETLANSAVDFLVRGDGEETFLQLLESSDYRSVPGISYRDGVQIVHNPPAKVEMDLNKYKRPAYHLVPMHLYYPGVGSYKRLPAINYMMTRGCPGKCTFCNSANTTLRTRGAELVVEDIKYLYQTYGIHEVEFFDDTFTVIKNNVMRFCELMKEAKLDVVWTAYARADCFSEELGRVMKEAGCHQVLLGVESGNAHILELLRKPIAFNRIKQAVRTAHQCGLDVRASYVVGNVGETLETLEETFRFAIELNTELAYFHICTPYPGTQLFRWAKQNNALVTEEWSDFEMAAFLLNLPTITAKEIFDFHQRVYGRYYMRGNMIMRRLARISGLAHLRDNLRALFYVLLRLKPHKASAFAHEWTQNHKADFFDIPIHSDGTAGTTMTWEIRQGINPQERKPTPLDIYRP